MSESPASGPCILIAQDIGSFAAQAQAWLAAEGYRVEAAEDGPQCLEKTRALAPALVLLDLMLPRIHGMEVLRQLKADPQSRRIGVIITTTKKYKQDLERAHELGAFDVLGKPFGREELLAAVGRFFQKAATTAAVGEAYAPRVGADRNYFRLWGTRGSIPVSGQRYVRHGGNTSCFEVGRGDETVYVDAGSGVRDLGMRLLKKGPHALSLLITHTHWDHIQGFPFFAPAYVPGFEITIYGAAGFNKDLKSVFSGQLDRDYFPVQFEDMRAKIEFRPLEPVMEIGGFRVTWEYTNHPAATVGYKFERDGRALAYASDNEYLYGYHGPPQDVALDSAVLEPDLRLTRWARGADVLIHEAQYLNDEYRSKLGWGHSSLSNACVLARLAEVRRWIVVHHDPVHEDDFLDQKLNLTREIFRRLNHPVPVAHGYDGMVEYW